MTRQVNPWAALSALCLGFFMILLDTTIVSIAIPPMVRGLSTGLNSVIWVMSVYLLSYAVLMLLASRLGDRFGPRRLYLAGLVVFTLASLWCGLSTTVGMLITARAVQGVGAALLTPQTLAFITHLFPPARRGPAMGMWGAVAGLATIAGPLLGGVLVDGYGWQWIFYVNVPVGVVAVVLTLLLVPDLRPKHSRSFDVPGILLSGAGLFLVVFGLQNGQQYHWGRAFGPVTVFEIIGAGVALLAVFVVWQRLNRREPLLPLGVFADRNFSAGTLTAVSVGFCVTAMFLPMVIYFQSVLGLTPTQAGLVTVPMSFLSGIVAPFIGRLSDRVDGKWLVLAGLALLGLGLGLAALAATPVSSVWVIIPGLLVCGLGIGSVFSPMSNVAMGSVEPRLIGTASGIYNTARQVGGVLGSAAMGVVLQARITASLAGDAGAAAGDLPERYRQAFVNGFAHASGSAGEFGSAGAPAAPPGVPADVAAQLDRLSQDVVHSGLTDGAKGALVLPIAVAVVGMLSALAMKRPARRPAQATPSTAPEAEPSTTSA